MLSMTKKEGERGLLGIEDSVQAEIESISILLLLLLLLAVVVIVIVINCFICMTASLYSIAKACI